MKKYQNQLILGIILSVTILIVIYALKWHAVYEEERKNATIITEYINEISMDEFPNYITENRDSVIYLGMTDDMACRKFESYFRKIIEEHHLDDRVVYINVNDLSGSNLEVDLDRLFSNENLRKQRRFLNGVPALAIYDDAQLVDFRIGDDLSKSSVIKLLKNYEVIEDMSY